MLKGGQKAISSVRRINVGKAKQIDKKLENVNEADDSALKAKMAKQMAMVKKHRESMKKHSGKDVKKANAARDRMKAAQAKVDDTQDKIIGIKKESVNEALKSKSNIIKLAGAVMSHMEDLVDYTGKDYDKAVNTFGTMIKNSLEQISRMNVKPHPQYDYSDKRSVHPMIKDEKSHLKFLNDYKKLTKKMIPLIKTLINKPSKPGIVKVMKYYNSSKYQEMNSVIATGDSTSYWKRTHGAMNKISERLVKLANKVGQLH
jgi:hypothetical protein